MWHEIHKGENIKKNFQNEVYNLMFKNTQSTRAIIKSGLKQYKLMQRLDIASYREFQPISQVMDFHISESKSL